MKRNRGDWKGECLTEAEDEHAFRNNPSLPPLRGLPGAGERFDDNSAPGISEPYILLPDQVQIVGPVPIQKISSKFTLRWFKVFLIFWNINNSQSECSKWAEHILCSKALQDWLLHQFH